MKSSLLMILFPFIIYAQAGINLTGMGIELNNYGRLRVYNQSLSGQQYIDQISILVATSPTTVFDYYQDSGIKDTLQRIFPNTQSDTGLYVSYNNSYSNLPPALTIKENIYGWTNTPFFLVKFTVFNNDSIPVNAITGLEIVPRVEGYFGSDTLSYNADKKYFKIYKRDKITGFKYLSSDGSQISSLSAFNWYPLYQKDTLYYKMMIKNIPDTTWFSNDQGAIVITGHQSGTLNPNDSLSFFYAFTMGDSDSLVSSRLDAATVKFNRIVTDVNSELAEIPTGYYLYQNYPNPFNPATTISFVIPKQQYIKLNVYNILGQKVSTLINEIKTSGLYKINFNASSLPSGIYIYRLEGEGINLSRKMILIK